MAFNLEDDYNAWFIAAGKPVKRGPMDPEVIPVIKGRCLYIPADWQGGEADQQLAENMGAITTTEDLPRQTRIAVKKAVDDPFPSTWEEVDKEDVRTVRGKKGIDDFMISRQYWKYYV